MVTKQRSKSAKASGLLNINLEVESCNFFLGLLITLFEILVFLGKVYPLFLAESVSEAGQACKSERRQRSLFSNCRREILLAECSNSIQKWASRRSDSQSKSQALLPVAKDSERLSPAKGISSCLYYQDDSSIIPCQP